MSTHTAVIDLLNNLGYSIDSGCCYGISVRWLEACFLNEEEVFHHRIMNIVANGKQLARIIKQKKRENDSRITTKTKASLFTDHQLDILAFCDSLKIYHHPFELALLFTQSLWQGNVEAISCFAASDKVASRGGIAQVYSEAGIYTHKELKKYLDDLAVAIKNSSPLNEPVGMILCDQHHAIALTYKTGVGWKFMDINQYPSESFTSEQTGLLAERIIMCFRSLFSPYVCFNTSVFTLGNTPQLPQLKRALNKLQKSHKLTKEIAGRADNKNNLAFIAAQNGHTAVIAKLAKHKANLDTPIDYGITPAYVAAQNGHTAVIAELAKHKANLNAPKSNMATPAFSAAQMGHAKVIAALAKHKANLDAPRHDGATPAIIAAQFGHVAVIAKLAKYKANLDTPMGNGASPAYAAAQNGHTAVIAELAKHEVNLNQPANTGATPAFIAAQYGHVAVIAKLAKHKANLDKPKHDGETPAFIAARKGHSAVIAKLAKYKADLDTPTKDGETPAFIAAKKGYSAVIAKLAKHKANLDTPRFDGTTPAFIAAQFDHAMVIAKLAKHKANLNTPRYDGATPAFIAAQKGYVAVIAKLAKHKANLDTPTNEMETPAFIAALQGHVAVIAKLGKHKANLNTPRYDGATPAFIAAQMGHAKVIAALAKHKANLDTPRHDGATPAFTAALHGYPAVITQLIKFGVDVNLPLTVSADNLRAFARTKRQGIIDRMNQFIANQPSTADEKKLSMTPYDIAVIMGHKKIIKLLDKRRTSDPHNQSKIAPLILKMGLMSETQKMHHTPLETEFETSMSSPIIKNTLSLSR